MPDTDGITLLREWSSQGGESCPVVMMSGHGTVETAVEATRLGAFDFVEKPLSLAKLLRTVERALEAGRRTRASGRLLAAASVAPVGKSRLMHELRADLAQLAAQCARAVHRRIRQRARGVRALSCASRVIARQRPFVILVGSTRARSDAEPLMLGNQSGE